jgi:hypothetical protein
MRLEPVAPFLALQAGRETTIAEIRVPVGLGRDASRQRGRRALGRAARLPARTLAGRRSVGQRGHGGGFGQTRFDAVRRRPAHLPRPLPRAARDELAMATLLAHFDIESVDSPTGGEAAERLMLTMGPVGPSMRLRART